MGWQSHHFTEMPGLGRRVWRLGPDAAPRHQPICLHKPCQTLGLLLLLDVSSSCECQKVQAGKLGGGQPYAMCPHSLQGMAGAHVPFSKASHLPTHPCQISVPHKCQALSSTLHLKAHSQAAHTVQCSPRMNNRDPVTESSHPLAVSTGFFWPLLRQLLQDWGQHGSGACPSLLPIQGMGD